MCVCVCVMQLTHGEGSEMVRVAGDLVHTLQQVLEQHQRLQDTRILSGMATR